MAPRLNSRLSVRLKVPLRDGILLDVIDQINGGGVFLVLHIIPLSSKYDFPSPHFGNGSSLRPLKVRTGQVSNLNH